MAQLRILRGREIGRVIELGAESIMGREDGNAVRLLDENSSRRHAKIDRLNNRFILYDLGSHNGTFVNGERVEERLLRDGDQIIIGKHMLVFEENSEERNRGVTVIQADDPGPVKVDGRFFAEQPPNFAEEGDDLQDAFRRLKRLYEITALLTSTLDLRTLTEGLAGFLQESLGADAVAVMRDLDEEPVARLRGTAKGSLVLSRTLVEKARKDRMAILVNETGTDTAGGARESIIAQKISSVLCAPLIRSGKCTGMLYADLRNTKRKFSDMDLGFITAVAHQAALAFENAYKFSQNRAQMGVLTEIVAGETKPIGNESRFAEALSVAERAAPADSTVLILGESGTGKELVARLVHDRSQRRTGPFAAINCAALVESLLDSELFGHEKGAFTGADRAVAGRIESAGSGTLFLDEIGDMPASLQAKLLRFLQERTYFRVGSSKSRTADVRIVAATNKDLPKAIRAGGFREDLYYRLGVVTITLPPLRERRGDIALLAEHFLARLRMRMPAHAKTILPEALEALRQYDWPGNVRELQNVIERAVILTDGPAITAASFPPELRAKGSATGDPPINLEEMEKWCIRRALDKTGGRKGDTAAMLGISWPTLNKKLKDYGMESGKAD